MTTEDQLERYLRERAEQIELPSPVIGGVADRARQRRRRRGVLTAGVAASALIVGAVALTSGFGDDDPQVTSHAAEPVDPTLEWTTVNAQAGTGWGSPAVLTDTGAVYRLSTAPGDSGGSGPGPQRLYRSDDGNDWSEVALPADLWANGLAVGGDQIYAVGTAPSGGGLTTLEMARSNADGWDVEQLPLDLEALSGDLPASSLSLRSPQVAVIDDTTVVAVNVVARPEQALVDLLPEGTDPYSVNVTPEGLEVYDHSTCEELVRAAVEHEQSVDRVLIGDPSAGTGDSEVCEADVTLRSWADLGMSEASVNALVGSTRIFAATGGEPFTEVAQLDGGAALSGIATAGDGVWLARTRWGTGFSEESVELLRSTDGRAWDAASTITSAGAFRGLGVLDGSAVVALQTTTQNGDVFETDLRLERLGAAGSEPLAVAPSEGVADQYAADVAFGPLGVAVVYGGPDRMVTYSPNGTDWSSHPLPQPAAGQMESVNGVIVTADAVKVRLNAYPEDDPSGSDPLAQRLLVGTPKG